MIDVDIYGRIHVLSFYFHVFKGGGNFRKMLKQFRKDISQTKYVWHVIEQCRDAAEL